jgi:EAL and modified HD-GYP domain-containing signal transduction protein
MDNVIFLGRSAVFDRQERVVGYELRLSATGDADADVSAEDFGRDVASVVLDLDLPRLSGGGMAFLVLPHTMWADAAYRLLPSEWVVLQVVADHEPDWETLAALDDARREGYRVALRWTGMDPVEANLAERFDIVGFEQPALVGALSNLLPLARRTRPLVMVDRVETREHFHECWVAGATYFEGSFFREPEVVAGRTLQADRISTVRLVAELARPDASIKRVNELVSQDLTLTYRLLRLVNAGFFGLGRPVESIQQALVLLGLQTVRSIATLLVLTDLEDKSPEVSISSLVRARTCENLARAVGGVDASAAYTVGLLSLLDAVLGSSLSEALASLPLADEVRDALLDGDGPLGELLSTAAELEAGKAPSASLLLDPARAAELHAEAILWTEQLRAATRDVSRPRRFGAGLLGQQTPGRRR